MVERVTSNDKVHGSIPCRGKHVRLFVLSGKFNLYFGTLELPLPTTHAADGKKNKTMPFYLFQYNIFIGLMSIVLEVIVDNQVGRAGEVRPVPVHGK